MRCVSQPLLQASRLVDQQIEISELCALNPLHISCGNRYICLHSSVEQHRSLPAAQAVGKTLAAANIVEIHVFCPTRNGIISSAFANSGRSGVDEIALDELCFNKVPHKRERRTCPRLRTCGMLMIVSLQPIQQMERSEVSEIPFTLLGTMTPRLLSRVLTNLLHRSVGAPFVSEQKTLLLPHWALASDPAGEATGGQDAWFSQAASQSKLADESEVEPQYCRVPASTARLYISTGSVSLWGARIAAPWTLTASPAAKARVRELSCIMAIGVSNQAV